MTDFTNLKARIIGTWVGNEANLSENPKATNIWLKFNELIQYLTDNFDTTVRSLFSVSGPGSYTPATGLITIQDFPLSVSNLSLNGEGELVVDFTDSNQTNLGAVGGGMVKSVAIAGEGKIKVTYQNGFIAEYQTSSLTHENFLYLPFEGNNGSTTTSQLGQSPLTATFLGGAVISNEQANNGLTSAKFPSGDGSAGISLVGTTNIDLNLEWEMELTFFPTNNSTPSGEVYSFVGGHTISFTDGFYFGYLENTCRFRILDSSGAVSFGHDFGANFFPLNAWNTIKVRREETETAGTFRMTIDANGSIIKDITTTTNQPTVTENIILGNNPALLSTAGCNGFIDLFSFKFL